MVMKFLAWGIKIDNPLVMTSMRIRLIDKIFLLQKKGNGTIEETCCNSLQSSTTDINVLAISIELWSFLLTTKLHTAKLCQAKLVK